MRNWRRGYVAVSNAWRKRSSPHRTKYLEANHGPDCNRNKQTQTPPKQCTAVPAPDHIYADDVQHVAGIDCVGKMSTTQNLCTHIYVELY